MESKPAKRLAAATSAGLSLLFVVVYGGCGWITAHRSDVGTWYYAWERFIPYVPWLIVPYMSIDLFFVAAPFLCHSKSELRTFTKRIAFAIIIAGACFLLIPLTTAVPRPQTDGWTKPIFDFLYGFDRPNNLLPSLHIALRTILASLYTRHSKGIVRSLAHIWFSLIGFSTLLTYQHHVVDIIGGFVLAGLCFYVFRETGERLPVIPNRRVGTYYALGASGTTVVAVTFWPVTSLFLWPALVLSITAAAYWGVGPAIYRKSQGCLPMCTQLLLAPSLFGQQLSLFHYRRQCNEWNQVAPGVLLGIKLGKAGAARAKQAGVTAVLDLTAEFSETLALRQLAYRNIPVLDLTQLTSRQMHDAADFIIEQSRAGTVYVHCKVGYSRGAAAIGAYLLKSGRAGNSSQCLAFLRQVRPGIVLRPEVSVALIEFERELGFGRAAWNQ